MATHSQVRVFEAASGYGRFDWPKWTPALTATVAMLALWSLRWWSWLFDPFGNIQQLIFNYEMLMELLSAVAWLLAGVIYIFCFARVVRRSDRRIEQAWLVMLAALCVVAFGEETSWGQHLVGFQTPESVLQVNFQRETNLHNLNLSHLLNLSPGGTMHSYLQNIGDLLTPAFFLVCFAVYAFLPMLHKNRYLVRFAVVRRAVVSNVAVVFLFANLPVYFYMNRIANAYELIEAALSFAVLVSAIDTRRTLPLHFANAD